MKASTPALILYIISGFLFFLSIVIDYEDLTLMVKPIIATSMLFYYWQESYGKANIWFLIVLFCLFVSGVLNLFEDVQTLLYVITFNLIAYSIILIFSIKALLQLNLKFFDKVNLTYIVLMFLFLSCLLYVGVFIVFDSSTDMHCIISVYGVVLVLMGILNMTLYTLNHNKANVYLLMATFSFIICDLFYIIYYYYYDFVFFRYVSVLCNIISFYFLVNYFLSRSNINENNESID